MQALDESSHPVRDALERAVSAALEACHSATTELEKMGQNPDTQPDEPGMKSLAKKANQLAHDVNELLGWLYPPRQGMTFEQILQSRA